MNVNKTNNEAHVATRYGATTTAEEVLADVDLRGRRILVTGVSAGMGEETARALVARGADVIGAASDLHKAQSAAERVRNETRGKGSIELIQLDLASLRSVRDCADALLGAARALDVIIANAGVMAVPKEQLPMGSRYNSRPIISDISC